MQLLIKLKKAKETRTKRTPKPKADVANVEAPEADTEVVAADTAGEAAAPEAGESSAPAAADAAQQSAAAPDAAGGDVVAEEASLADSSDSEGKMPDLDGIDNGSDTPNPDEEDMIEEQVDEVPHWYKLRAD